MCCTVAPTRRCFPIKSDDVDVAGEYYIAFIETHDMNLVATVSATQLHYLHDRICYLVVLLMLVVQPALPSAVCLVSWQSAACSCMHIHCIVASVWL